jgi:hypothetical protein
MPHAVKRSPAGGIGGEEHHDARRAERAGEMGHAGVVADQHASAGDDQGQSAHRDVACRHEARGPHVRRHFLADRTFRRRAGEHDVESQRAQRVADRGKTLARPPLVGGPRAWMQADIAMALERGHPGKLRRLGRVAVGERELEMLTAGACADMLGERNEAPDLVPVLRIGKVRCVDRMLRRREARGRVRGEQLDDRVGTHAVAVHLQRDVVTSTLHLGQKSRNRTDVGTAFRQSGKPRERDEIVDDMRIAPNECRGPWQTDERHARARNRVPQGPQRRHGTQHVAELQRAEDGNATRIGRASREEVVGHATSGARRVPPMLRVTFATQANDPDRDATIGSGPQARSSPDSRSLTSAWSVRLTGVRYRARVHARRRSR